MKSQASFNLMLWFFVSNNSPLTSHLCSRSIWLYQLHLSFVDIIVPSIFSKQCCSGINATKNIYCTVTVCWKCWFIINIRTKLQCWDAYRIVPASINNVNTQQFITITGCKQNSSCVNQHYQYLAVNYLNFNVHTYTYNCRIYHQLNLWSIKYLNMLSYLWYVKFPDIW